MRTAAGLALIHDHPELLEAVLLIEEQAVEFGFALAVETLKRVLRDGKFLYVKEGSETE